jgi:hypothetical protein
MTNVTIAAPKRWWLRPRDRTFSEICIGYPWIRSAVAKRFDRAPRLVLERVVVNREVGCLA